MKKNIIWIVIDCVRNYQSGLDDRDKLDVMYKLEKEFVSFEKMMVSAPSSIMSAANFFTSIPSYYLAGNYSQFKFDNDSYWCINDILKIYGYSNYAIMNAYDCRSMLGDFVDIVPKKFLTKKVRPTMMRWPNKEVSKIFKNVLDSNPKQPAFYFLWYNTRLDPNISDEIDLLIKDIKSRNLFKDSVVIVTSDHGYPDRSRGLVSDGWDLLKAGIPHDILLTNDNINIPFLLYYPGVKPRKVKHLVSTEDIVPTLMDLLQINLPYEKKLPLFGKSLIPLIDKSKINNDSLAFFKNRVIRSDARFSLQKDRMTSLQKNNYHYIVKHDDGSEELYDTNSDIKERNNIASKFNNKDILHFFRVYFKRENLKILNIQKKNTQDKLILSFENLKKLKINFNECYVIAFGNSYLNLTILECLIKVFPKIKISFLYSKKLVEIDYNKSNNIEFVEIDKKEDLKKFKRKELVIEVVDDPSNADFRKNYKIFTSIKGKYYLRVDWTGMVRLTKFKYINDPTLLNHKRNINKIVNKIKLGFYEPRYFISELKRIINKIFK